MATRKIDTRIARDNSWKEMPIRVRYLWLYLLTNSFTKTCGVYEIPLEYMSLETSLDIGELKQYLMSLTDMGLITYSMETEEIAIYNYPKYNVFGWKDYLANIISNEISEIRDMTLIGKMIEHLQETIANNPNDKRNLYLTKVLELYSIKGKEYKIEIKDKDKDKENMEEINNACEELEEQIRIAHIPWVNTDDD